MSENTAVNAPANEAQEIEEIIAGLQEYRERIIHDTLEMAKKMKISKQVAMANLAQHPEIARIDAMLEDLHARLASKRSPSTPE